MEKLKLVSPFHFTVEKITTLASQLETHTLAVLPVPTI
jgi:hypothetical protein